MDKLKINDISKLAGVSPSTVSRVMNKSGYVSEQVRTKVEQVIKETGYMPNEVAKSLKIKKTNVIGIIVPKITTETAGRVVNGVATVANKNGYSLIIANTNLDVAEEIKYLKVFQQKSVDGIILMATQITEKHKKIINEMNIPIVFVGQNVQGEACIVHDDYNAAKSMMDILIKNGHREIAYLGVTSKDIAVGKIRKNAYMDTIKENNITINKNLIEIGQFSIESGYSSMKSIIEKGLKPTAVFAVTDNIAIGAMHYLMNSGFRVPEDISVVGMGDEKIAKYFNPALTTVHYYYNTSGIEACNMLLKMIDKETKAKNTMIMGYEIKLRESVKAL